MTEQRKMFEAPIESVLRRRVIVGLIAAVLLTASVGVWSWHSARRAEQDAYWVSHTYEVMATIQGTSRAALEAETSARAFALSGQEPLLVHYQTARAIAYLDKDVLRRLTVDNQSQQRRLEVLEPQIRAAFEFADSIIAKRRQLGTYPGGSDALEVERLLVGIRATFADMQAEEARLLGQRMRAAQSGQQWTRIVAVAGVLVGLGLWTVAFFVIIRSIGGSERSRAELTNLNAELEKRVEDRTAALKLEIADRRRTQEIAERLAAVVESSDDAIISKTLEGTITAWNRGAERVFGYSAAEAVGRSMTLLLPPDRAEEETDILARISRGESVNHYETIRMRKDGSKINVSVTISPIRDSRGGITGASKIARDITERKSKEEQLKESEDRFRLFVEHAPASLAMFDREMRYLHVSRRWQTDYALSDRDLRGVSHYEVFPEVPERWKEMHRRGLAGEILQVECDRFDRPDGAVQWIRWEIRPWYDRTGAIGGIVVFTEDITERRAAEEKLRESERSFHAMLDGIPQLAWTAEADGSIFWFNQRWYDYTGTTAEQSMGWDWQKMHDPEILPMVLERWKTAIADGTPFEMEFPLLAGDGHFGMFLTRVMPLKDAGGHVVRWFGTNTDITQRRQVEEQVARQAEELACRAKELAYSWQALETQTLMLQSVLDSMGEGLIAADREGHFLIWNDSAKKLMGRDAFDLPTQQWSPHYKVFLPDGVTPYPASELPLVRALNGESVREELMIEHPERPEWVFLEVTARPLKDNQGNLGGGVAVLRDITAHKAAEREIRALNQNLETRVIERTAELKVANKELEAFTYSVSHDLRAPIRHISGFTKILMEKFYSSLPTEAQRHLQTIEQAAGRMGQMVDEMLKLARLGRQALEFEVADLDLLVTDVIALLKPEIEGRQVQWKIEDLPAIECDRILIRQVFQNLISNALKYSRPRSPAVIEIGHVEKDGEKVIFVKDNGVGFDTKYSDKLFGVFQRLHVAAEFEGTGIGLATVERIIKKHGGRVWAEAEIDRGATFYFTLGGAKHSVLESTAATAGGSR
jgi:PAS domain S-box-containing protein